jgi:hypothetical protein
MVTQVERVMGRRQVDAEINSDPIIIFPERRTKIEDGAGGWTWSTWTPVTEQGFEVAITTAKRRLSDMIVGTELGDVVRAPYIVIARHDVDLRRDDQFDWNGDRFYVCGIQIKTDVQITAQIDYLAGGGALNG